MNWLIAHTRQVMPDVGIQVPPNLADCGWSSSRVGGGGASEPEEGGGRWAERERRSHLAQLPFPPRRIRCRKELQRELATR